MNLHDPMRTEATGENQQGSLIETEAPHWTAEAFGHVDSRGEYQHISGYTEGTF